MQQIYNVLYTLMGDSPSITRVKRISKDPGKRNKHISIAKYTKGRTVLDIGCSVGAFSLLMSKYAHQVIGIDVSAPAITTARQAAKKMNITNANFRVLDFWSLTPEMLKDWKIDTIFTHKTFGDIGNGCERLLEK